MMEKRFSEHGIRRAYKKCNRVVCLVSAPNASKMQKMNDGFQMTAEGVVDALNSKFTCNLTAFCTLTSAGEYQLKPGRGKKAVLAFVTISNVLIEATEENPPTFLAESIEKLGEEEANDAPEHLRRMIHFAALAADQ